MATVLDNIVVPALKEIGVLAAGEPLTAEDGADALLAFNRRIDQAAAENLSIYAFTRTLFTITPSLGTYAVGSGVAVNRVRPVFVETVKWIDTATTPDTEYPLRKLTREEWMAIVQKDAESTIPSSFYYDPTYPTGTLYLYPIPTNSNMQGAFYAPTAVTSYASLGTSFALPPGYEEWLVTDLAIALAPSYSKVVGRDLKEKATEAKAIVKRSNSQAKTLYFPADAPGVGWGGWNIYTGDPQ